MMTGTAVLEGTLSLLPAEEGAGTGKEAAEEEGQHPKRERVEGSEQAAPPKKLRQELAERVPSLLAKVEQGFDLTSKALPPGSPPEASARPARVCVRVSLG